MRYEQWIISHITFQFNYYITSRLNNFPIGIMLTNFLIPFSWQCVPGYSCNRTVSILLSVLIFFDGVNSSSKPLLCLSLSPAYCLLVSLSLVFPLFFRTLSCLLQRRRGYRIRWRLSKLLQRTLKPVTRSFAEFAVDLE